MSPLIKSTLLWEVASIQMFLLPPVLLSLPPLPLVTTGLGPSMALLYELVYIRVGIAS